MKVSMIETTESVSVVVEEEEEEEGRETVRVSSTSALRGSWSVIF